MDNNSLTVASTFDIDDDDKTDYLNDISTLFKRDGDRYHYNGAPNVTAFTDHGTSITSEFDNAEIAHAMTLLAVSKGWETYKTKGTNEFYSEVEKRSEQLIKERQTNSITNGKNVPENEPTPADNEPTEQTLSEDERIKLRIKAEKTLHEQYRVHGKKYYFKDARASNNIAFKDKGDKLTTSWNNEAVTRSMVNKAVAAGWKSVHVGYGSHKDFKRMVWNEAQAQGLTMTGYKPTADEIALHVKPVPENTKKNTTGQSNQHTSESNNNTSQVKPKRQVLDAVATAVVNDRIADPESREKTLAAINDSIQEKQPDLHDIEMYEQINKQQTQTRKTGKTLSR